MLLRRHKPSHVITTVIVPIVLARILLLSSTISVTHNFETIGCSVEPQKQ